MSGPGAGVWGLSPDVGWERPPGLVSSMASVPHPGTEDPKEPHLSSPPRFPVAGSSVVWARKKVIELLTLRSEPALKDHPGSSRIPSWMELIPFSQQTFVEHLLHTGHWESKTELADKNS